MGVMVRLEAEREEEEEGADAVDREDVFDIPVTCVEEEGIRFRFTEVDEGSRVRFL